MLLHRSEIQKAVESAVQRTRVTDVHTHLYAPQFGELLLSGIDELLVYHYLIAEGFRFHQREPVKFFKLTKAQQAELIWDELFVQRQPLSEACRGVVTTLNRLGLEVRKKDLNSLRQWFRQQKPDAYINLCMKLAGVGKIYMTNSPFDPLELPVWERGYREDERFEAALRIDPLIVAWEKTVPVLRQAGYQVTAKLTPKSIAEAQRYLRIWAKRMQARYVMVSLPPDFNFPGNDTRAQVIEKIVLPVCASEGLPFALMLGVKRAVNPALQMAGDGVGRSDLVALQNLCAGYPGIRFLATILSRENLYEAGVLARKFPNLHLFGCWWFTNVPSVIQENVRLRLELLGSSFTAQHSDARVVDQLIYKWAHTRTILAQILTERYQGLVEAGWPVTKLDVQNDVKALLGGAFEEFAQGRSVRAA